MSLTGSSSQTSLRLWPGIAAVVLLVSLWLAAPLVPDGAMLAVLGGVVCGLVVLVWWVFFSRAPWIERIGVVALMAVAVAATRVFVHPSISNGMMGLLIVIYSIPALGLALVAAAVVTRRSSSGRRRVAIAGAVALACSAFVLVRTAGISGGGTSDFHWRWTPTPEDRLLAESVAAPLPAPATTAAPAPAPAPRATPTPAPAEAAVEEPPTGDAEWPGFRGDSRSSVVRAAPIAIDWTTSPPVELWRRPIGPGWSSFAVSGDLIYTQEQRGDDEVVSCYRLSTGEPVWAHRDPIRFWESNGGAGPRATPTLHDGRVYALGATGLLNALDAATGALLWSRDAATELGRQVPGWGFAGSPLSIDGAVIVALSGQLAAFDARTGAPRWSAPVFGGGYSSPHRVTIDGVDQVLLLTGAGATSVAPGDGSILWQHAWSTGVAIVQPAMTADGDVLIIGGDAMGGVGIRRVTVTRTSGTWTAEERWTSRGLKPYFNDYVVHEGHAYGFDGSILACIDLADGARTWKGGRYGHGQMVLLPDQDLLLVLSEDGELALVGAAPDGFREVARVPALEGKTWNHPVLTGDVLLVRNGEEMAAFRLAPATGRSPADASATLPIVTSRR